MKAFLIFCSLILFSGSVVAQTTDSGIATERKFYVGLGLTNISYHIYYKNSQAPGDINTGYFGPVFIHLGYKLNGKANLQVGLAYGGSKSKDDGFASSTDTVQYSFYSRTRVVALPVTLHHDLFRAFRRFPVYATATLMPAYGMSKSRTEETRDSGTTTYWLKETGLNVFATAGFGFNYRISNRLQGYAEILPFKYNITGRNSKDLDWEQYASKSRQLYRSLGFGVNYSL